MKFVIAREDLIEAMGKLQNVVSQRPALPLLANFLLEAKDGELVMTATDLTVGVRCWLGAHITREGGTTLPARRFFQLVRELTAAQVEIDTDSSELTCVRCGSSQFKLCGMARTEFPQLPLFDRASSFKLSQTELKELFFRTSFAVSKEDSRYALTGVLMHISEGRLTLVGTDGKRLAKCFSTTELPVEIEGSYIIPSKAVDEVFKTLRDTEEEIVEVFLDGDKVAFDYNKTRLMTKLVAGDYPDYQRVIPPECKVEIHLHREELMSLLRQVSLFTTEANPSIRCCLDQEMLTLSAVNAEIGEGKVQMPLHYEGPRFDIAFNPGYFLDILRHCRQETVTLGLIDAFNPGMISDEERTLFVLMPMRLVDLPKELASSKEDEPVVQQPDSEDENVGVAEQIEPEMAPPL